MTNETHQAALNVGIAGFNVIEECGIVRWGKEYFPHIKIHILRDGYEPPAIDGLVISDRVYGTFKPLFKPTCPILLLTHGQYGRPLREGVSVIDTMGATLEVEGGIAQWLSQLMQMRSMGGGQVRSIRLSPREMQIAEKLKQGCSNDTIATQLGIEVTTVKTHLHRIYMKLGAVNRAHAVAIFVALR